MSVNIPDLPDNVEVSELDGVTTVAIDGNSKGLEVEAAGEVEINASGTVTKLSVTTEKGEALGLTLDASKPESDGASLKTSEPGLFKKATITGGNKGDSVKFTGKTTVQRSTLDMGEGPDTVVFGAKTQFVKTTTVDLGPAGGKADKVVFKGDNTPEGGKVKITNFDSKDKLLVDGVVYKAKDLEDMKIDGIKIEFAD